MSDQTKKPVYINRENFTDKIKSYLRHPGSMILMFLVMLATFIGQCICYTGIDQYGCYDTAFAFDRSTIWYFFSNLSCGIRRKGE